MLTRSLASCVLAASSAFALCAAPASVRAHGDNGGNAAKSLVKLVDIAVQDVDVVNGEMVATAELTFDVVGRKLVRTVDLPIEVGATQGETCDILNLSLGPIRLNVLGLMVRLDNCEGGPITVDIGAVPGGGLLGDLLCGLAGGLLSDIELQELFDALSVEEQATVAGLLEFLLSDALGGSLTDCANLADTHAHAAAAKRKNCDLLTLEVQPISLNLLGLTVDTSAICLDVWARRGQGNLLGNLLCQLTELLDKPGQSLGPVRNLTNRIRGAVVNLRQVAR